MKEIKRSDRQKVDLCLRLKIKCEKSSSAERESVCQKKKIVVSLVKVKDKR